LFNIGSTYAAVLPVPDLEAAITSIFLFIIGTTFLCTAVGFSYPWSSIALLIEELKLNSINFLIVIL
jgi:hypothetical protein